MQRTTRLVATILVVGTVASLTGAALATAGDPRSRLQAQEFADSVPAGSNGTPTVRALPPSPDAGALLAGQARLWDETDRGEVARGALRRQNPEWDFMSRTFTAWALAEDALAHPDHQASLDLLDAILVDTLAREAGGGFETFLLPYGRSQPFLAQPARSLFVDGELALALSLRRLARDDGRWDEEARARVDEVARRMAADPLRSYESYPDEYWLFCTTVGLAATAVADAVDGEDASRARLRREWVSVARERLIHEESGLLVSSWTHDGTPKDGPEGSSVFLAAHMLRVVDPALAAEQYTAAKRELGGSLMGMGYAKEWPGSWRGPHDVDAGQIVPGLDASPSASGLALVAARSFGDTEWAGQLQAALDVVGGRTQEGGALRYAVAGPMGDAVITYAAVGGEAWGRVTGR